MQERIALRKTLKKVAAVGTSLAMVGVTISGALAAGLSDYSTTFSKSNTAVVFGATGSDSAAVSDVVAGLPGGAASTTTVDVVEGALSVDDFEEGERADFEMGNNVSHSDAFGQSCFTDNDDIGLEEWDQNVNINVDQDYKVNEQFCFGVGAREPRLSNALAELDDDFGTNPLFLVPRYGLNYSLVWQKDLPVSNRVANATSTKQITVDNFLGKKLIISGGGTGANIASQFTALVGEEFQMRTGDTLVFNGHTIKVVAIDANEVMVDVDGDTSTIDENSNKRLGGMEVHIDSAIETTDGEGIANLFVGDDASETFNSGDHFAGEDDDHYLWRWALASLDTTRPIIGLELAENFDNDRTDLEDEIMDLNLLRGNRNHLLEGDYVCLPNYYECVVLEGAVKEVDYADYVASADGITDDLPGYGSTGTTSNAKVLEFKASGAGSDEGFRVDTTGDGTFETATDRVLLFWDNDLNSDAAAGALGEILVFYENSNGNVTATNLTTSSYGYDGADANGTLATSKALFQLDNDDFDNADVVFWDILNSSGLDPGVITANSTNLDRVQMAIELDDEGGTTNGIHPRIWFEAGIATAESDGIVSLGTQVGEDTTKYFRYSSNASNANDSIASFDEDVLSNSGIVVEDPEGNYNSDQIRLKVINDDENKFWVRLARPKAGTVSTTSGTLTSSASMSDEEVGDVSTLGKNVIAVGGPAVNKAAADLLGVDFPSYGADLAGLAEGTAVLEMKSMSNGKMALLVYGWEEDDTRRAAVLLKDPAVLVQKLSDAGKSDADSVTVTGTDLTVAGITVA